MTQPLLPAFPFFRQHFLSAAAWPDSCLPEERQHRGEAQGSLSGSAIPSASSHMELQGAGLHTRVPNLRTLDLKALMRDDGPPSETQLRRAKFQLFDKEVT